MVYFLCKIVMILSDDKESKSSFPVQKTLPRLRAMSGILIEVHFGASMVKFFYGIKTRRIVVMASAALTQQSIN